jgi:tryptophan synthase beta chain
VTTKKSTTVKRASKTTTAVMTPANNGGKISEQQRPDAAGRYGAYGGKYVPETLIPALLDLEREYEAIKKDPEFQAELANILKDYVGRENPLYFAERLTEEFADENGNGPQIYLKREDLNHTGGAQDQQRHRSSALGEAHG